MSWDLLLFLALAFVSIVSGVAVIATKSAIRAALALVVNFFVLAVFYFTLGSQLLGVVQVFVYLGAIMVLFLFCIMLLRVGPEDALTEKVGLRPVVAGLLSVGLMGLLVSQVFRPLQATAQVVAEHQQVSTVEAVGQGLFTRWSFPFEVTSLLLLVGIVGSILLAKRRL